MQKHFNIISKALSILTNHPCQIQMIVAAERIENQKFVLLPCSVDIFYELAAMFLTNFDFFNTYFLFFFLKFAGAASVAKGISEYTNRMADDAISNAFKSIAPMHSEYLGEYIDFFAMGLCMLLAAILAIGVRSSTIANNFFTLVNLSVVLFVIISGLFKGIV